MAKFTLADGTEIEAFTAEEVEKLTESKVSGLKNKVSELLTETKTEREKRQPTSFQDEVLGVERAKLFRGGMNVDKFTDDEGRTLTLDQLKQLENITL